MCACVLSCLCLGCIRLCDLPFLVSYGIGEAHSEAVEFVVVDKMAHIVKRDYHLPRPRLPCQQPAASGPGGRSSTSSSVSQFFSSVTSHSIESISSLVRSQVLFHKVTSPKGNSPA